MITADTFPETFPGKELAVETNDYGRSVYHYQISYVRYAHATAPDSGITLPAVEYRELAEVNWPDGRYADAAAPSIDVSLLDDSQEAGIGYSQKY